ncbi:MAG: methyltransferase [Pedosphaera sp.]|nr:methyltransferase [Pedosphaera sp.]
MIDSAYELVELANGSWSVRSREAMETFHPVVGPEAEARSLYVEQLRLPERMAAASGPFVLWDVGLGSAANVLTVLRSGREVANSLRVISFDHTLGPLRFGLEHATQLPYFESYETAVRQLLDYGRADFMNHRQHVQWEVMEGDFPTLMGCDCAITPPASILYDAYSPARNAAMWTLPLFRNLFGRLSASVPCNLATYSRSTMLRVTLLLAGFWVGAGEATGDKEETTVAATDPELIPRLLGADWLMRVRRSTSAEPLRHPTYHQNRLSDESRHLLERHPQFQSVRAAAKD